MTRSVVLRAVAILLLALTTKLAFLSAPRPDLLGERESNGAPLAFHGEEFSRASIALEVREGPLIPVLDYQWTHFFGGSLVVGLCAIPSFAVFGESLFSLKLVPLAFELLAVLCGYLVLRRAFGERAALIGGALLAVSAPGPAVLSTVAWGTHSSLNAFVWLGLLAYLRVLDALDAGHRARGRAFLCGVAWGFAVWFGYGALVGLAAVAAHYTWRDPRGWARGAVLFGLAGALVGLAPWLRYNLLYDFAGLEIYGANVTEHFDPLRELARAPGRLARLLFVHLPAGMWHRDALGVPAVALTVLAGGATLIAALVGVVASVRRRPRRSADGARVAPGAAALIGVHAALYAAALLSSEFRPDVDARSAVEFRYLAPLYPALFGFAAAGVDALLGDGTRRAPRALGASLLAVALAANLAGVAGLVATDQAGRFHEVEVTGRRGHGRWLAQRFGDDPDRMEAIARGARERRADPARAELLQGMRSGLDVLIQRQRRVGGPYSLEGLETSRARLFPARGDGAATDAADRADD